MRVEAKKKLAELPITWKEAYTDRTSFLREQFEDVIGPGSYFRWEGRNSETGDEYYVVVSPANIRKPKAMFFAGVRKLPSDYAAYGEEFSEIKEAVKYAAETWGTPIPANMRHYDSSDLKGLSKRIKDWKEARDTEDAEGTREAKSVWDIMKEGMARRPGDENWENREGYIWLNLKNILARQSPDWQLYQQTIQSERSFTAPNESTPVEKAIEQAIVEKNHWTNEMLKKYGLRDPVFYQMWIVHKPEAGTQASYIFSIAPHSSTHLRDDNGLAITSFGIFKRAISTITEEQVYAKRAEFINKIKNMYPWMDEAGVVFSDDDFVTAPLIGQNKGAIRLSEDGEQKWTEAILEWYRNTVEVTTEDNRKFIFKDKEEGLQKLRRKGIKVKDVQSMLTPEIEEKIRKNPQGGWKSELKRLSKRYVEEWQDAYNRAKHQAVQAGFNGADINQSKQVAAFLDTTPKPPIYNDDVMKMQVGSIASSPIYFKPAYLLKKKSYFEKPDLQGKNTLELVDVKDLEPGDEVSLVSKVFVYDPTGAQKVTYDDGRPKRQTIETPIGTITAVDPATNTIQLDGPISYETQEGMNPFSLSVTKQSGQRKKREFGYDTLFDAYNALRINVSPQLELPDFTQNVTSNYLMDCLSRRRQGLAPAPLQTEMLEDHADEEKTFEQMKSDVASPSDIVGPILNTEKPEEVPTVAPEPAATQPTPQKPRHEDLGAIEDELFFGGEPLAPATKTPSKTKSKKSAPKSKKPVPQPEPESEPVEGIDEFASAMMNLVKLAESFDRNGEYEKAEEVHAILRKYRNEL